MYYRNRVEAGRRLAAELGDYRTQNSVVVALSESSVLVAVQIAMELHANLLLFLTRDIKLPGEHRSVAAVSSAGTFGYNDSLSSGEVTEIKNEFHNYMEQERFKRMHEINMLVGSDGEIDKKLLRHRNIILVADALDDGFRLMLAHQFLRTVAIKKIIVAVPVASVPAVDKMHIVADELYVGGVTDNFLSVDHYYDENHQLDMESIMKILRNVSLTWHRTERNPAHHQGHKRSRVLIRKAATRR